MKHILLALIAALAVACSAKQAATAAPAQTEAAYLAGGCFWCVEHDMAKIPGVVDVVSGYAGGTVPNPTYQSHEGYREAVKVVFDPAKVSYRQLVDRFWPLIDPTVNLAAEPESLWPARWIVRDRNPITPSP